MSRPIDEHPSGDAGLTVTVLGCSGTYAAAGVPCTGFLVRGGGVAVWLDCGPGTLANLQNHVSLDALDAVVVTHCHPDHWLELPVVFNACRYGIDRSGLAVYGTGETLDLLGELIGEPVRPTFDWTTVSDGSEIAIGEQRWRFSRTDHPVETLATHVTVGDETMAFSADTGPGWEFERFGLPIDLALCESTVLDHDRRADLPHLSARMAGERAARAGAGALVLTHLLPGEDAAQHRIEASRAYGAPVDIAEIGASYRAGHGETGEVQRS